MEYRKTDKFMVPVILGVSVFVPVLVLILMYLPQRYNFLGIEMGNFPLFHAVLNFFTALVLIAGYYFMRVKELIWHRNMMISAFFLSAVFLISYVISKISNEPVPYGGEGILRPIYFFILITHILLSAIIVPLVLFTMYRGLTGQVEKHRKIARYTFPVWLYVAITGVLVYVFMAPYY
jgi:putative membrane protein